MTPIPKIGDRATNYRTGKSDLIAKVTPLKASGKIQVYLQLISGGAPFPLSDCTPGPEYDEPLSDSDVEAISQIIRDCLQSGDVRDLTGWKDGQGWHEPLQASLTAGQKRQVLGNLSAAEREVLKAILEQAQRRAA